MEKLNNSSDVEKYKQSTPLTKPFLSKELIHEKIMLDLKHKHKEGEHIYYLKSLYYWIKHNVKYSAEPKIQAKKFQRSANEIWESGKASGCTDFAILYATFARTLGIPATILHTAEYGWVKKLQNGEDYSVHYGHSFCECYFNGKWVLVDPTCCRVVENYNLDKLELPYQVGGKSVYLPYYRGLDLGGKQNVEEHNKKMDEACRAL